MADLVVDLGKLKESSTQLANILHELKNMGETWEDHSVWGHGTVTQAMKDFVEDWWVKREKLQGSVDELQKMMQQSAEEWEKADKDLAEGIKPGEK